jgi:hypothetical protein
MILHFAGSSSREYSSSSGDWSACGSGYRASPCPVSAKRPLNSREEFGLANHDPIVAEPR